VAEVLVNGKSAGIIGWQPYELVLNTNRAMYLLIWHTSTDPNAVLCIDNAEVTDYAVRDSTMWTLTTP
jgi:hypothetical protein